MAKHLIIFLVLLVGGCKEPHDLLLDNKSSFTLIVRNLDSGKSKQIIFEPDSKEYMSLNNWLQQNKNHWEKEPVKWLSPFEIYGNNYRLQFSKEAAVIKLEREDKYLMWRKKIDETLVNIFKEHKNT